MTDLQEENGAHNDVSTGVKIHGLIEETKRMNKENEGSPKMMHECSLKAPMRVSNSKLHNLSNFIAYSIDVIKFVILWYPVWPGDQLKTGWGFEFLFTYAILHSVSF